MKLFHFARVGLVGWVLIRGLSTPAPAQAPIYQAVPLDAGGWVSGFAQHPAGKLYGYGDTFGVYCSDDFGAHWRFLQNSLTETATTVYGLAVSPTDANRVAFFGPSGLWNSSDGGEAWTKRLDDITSVTWQPEFQRTRGASPLAYHPTQANELWIAASRKGQSGSLWRTSDHGLTWSPVGGTTFVKEQVTTIHFLPQFPNEVWVGTAAYADRRQSGGLWCSVDGGATWRKVWDNRGQKNRINAPPQVNSIARNAAHVSVIATNMGVWQVTSTNWNDPQTYVATQRAFVDENIPNVTALTDGTFWASELGNTPSEPKVSTDGITWTDRPISLSPASVPEWLTAAQMTARGIQGRDALVQDAKNPARWLLTGVGSAHLSEDNGLTWRYQPGSMAGLRGFRVDFDLTQPGRAYLCTADRGIFVIDDGGLSGKTVHSSSRSFGELHTFHETMVSADGQTLIGAGVRHETNRTVIICSTDGGATWTKVTSRGLPENYDGITRAVMSLDDPQDFLVLLGSRFEHTGSYHDMGPGGGQPNRPGLYRTTDGGANFVPVGGAWFEGVDMGMRAHPELAFLERDGVNPNIRYLALRAANQTSARGVWRSSDRGTSWTLRENPFPGDSIATLAVDSTVEGGLWAGGPKLRRSDDGGGSWSDVADFTSVSSVSSYGGRLAVLGRRNEERFNKVYASADNGAHWQEMTTPEKRLNWAQNVTVDPWRAGQIWVAGWRSFEIINPPNNLAALLTGAAPGDGVKPIFRGQAEARKTDPTLSSNDLVNPAREVALNVIVGAAPPVITPGESKTASRGGIVSYAVKASNSPSSWALVSGHLPRGVTLDTARGVLSGTALNEGVFQPVLTATNGAGTSARQTLTLTITPPAPGTNYDFNVNQAHFEETFNQTSGWPWGRTAGVGGTGGLETDSNDRAARLPDSVITFHTAGQSIKLGISFKARVDTKSGTAGGDSLRVGLSRTNAPFGNEGQLQLAVGLNKASSTAPLSALSVDSRDGTTLATTGTEALPLVDNHWYAVDSTIRYNGLSSFTVTTSLSDLGANGVTLPVLLDSYTITRTGLTSLVNVPLFPGFQGRNTNGSGGVRVFDNFHAIRD